MKPWERHLHRFPASHYTTSNDSAVCGGVPVLGPTVESAVESARHVCATGGARIFVSAAVEKEVKAWECANDPKHKCPVT